jgi:hypothetical protein
VAIPLKANIYNTEDILKEAMPWMNQEQRVQFLVPAGKGEAWIQRIRVKISRVRNHMKKRGKKYRYFNLRSSVHPHTEGGIRYDCVILWTTQNAAHEGIELLEGLFGE